MITTMCAYIEDFCGNVEVASMFLAFDVEIVSDNARTHQNKSGPSISSRSDRSTSCRWASSCCESPRSPPSQTSKDEKRNACQARSPTRCASDDVKQDLHKSRRTKLRTNTAGPESSMLRLPTIPLIPKMQAESQDSFPPRIPPRSWLDSS